MSFEDSPKISKAKALGHIFSEIPLLFRFGPCICYYYYFFLYFVVIKHFNCKKCPWTRNRYFWWCFGLVSFSPYPSVYSKQISMVCHAVCIWLPRPQSRLAFCFLFHIFFLFIYFGDAADNKKCKRTYQPTQPFLYSTLDKRRIS